MNDTEEKLVEKNQLSESEIEELTSTGVEAHDPSPKEVAKRSESGLVKTDGRIEDRESDYNYARTNLYDVIEKGTLALEEIVDFAGKAQSARAYEVVGQLVRTLTESNEKLINLHQQMKELEAVSKNTKNAPGAGTINNIIFHGTTEELFEAVDQRKKITEKK